MLRMQILFEEFSELVALFVLDLFAQPKLWPLLQIIKTWWLFLVNFKILDYWKEEKEEMKPNEKK